MLFDLKKPVKKGKKRFQAFNVSLVGRPFYDDAEMQTVIKYLNVMTPERWEQLKGKS